MAGFTAERNWELGSAAVEAGAALILALVGAYLLLRRILKVVDKVTKTADQIGRQGLRGRLDYSGPDDEVGRLAHTFDFMLSQIEAAMDSQRRLLSDASHQLRTPLTVIRGHLDVLARGKCDDPKEVYETVALVLNELDHTTLLVERMLLLGRSLEPGFIQSEQIPLRAFLEDIFEASRVLAERRWSLGPTPDIILAGDRAKIRGALFNLIDNAVKATDPGDEISIQAQLGEDLVLSVVDTGRGIPAGQQSAVLERFAQLKSTNGRGHGLGLAIVKGVVEGHGGRVTLESAPDRGCTVHMHLPRSRTTALPASASPVAR